MGPFFKWQSNKRRGYDTLRRRWGKHYWVLTLKKVSFFSGKQAIARRKEIGALN